jgi:hypothetical protein
MIKGMPNTDYKELSFNQLIELVGNLYEEITRLTAERKASNEALNQLTNNIQVSQYSIDRIKEATKKGTLEALEESKRIRIAKKVQIKAKRKK